MERYILFQTSYKFSTEFYFWNCGWQHREPNVFYGPARRDFYLLHFAMDGRGVFLKDEKRLPIGKNQGFLIVPFETTTYGAQPDSSWDYYWIGFNGSDCKKLLKMCGLDEENRVFRFDGEKIAPLFERLMRLDKNTMSGVFKAQSILLEIISEMLIVDENREPRRKSSDCFKRAVEYIESNYAKNPRVTELAAELFIDRSQLYRLFVKKLGCSPEQYLNAVKLTKACEILRNTTLPIADVAEQCGFDSPSLFCRNFKRKYGVTPRSYRKSPFETQ